MTEQMTRPSQHSEPETYKRLILACGLFAGIALGVGTAIQRPYIAVGLYALGIVGAVAVPYTTDYTLFDERDDTIHRRASGTTLAAFGWLSALVFPSLVVLSSTPTFAWGPASAAVAWTTAVVYGCYALLVGYYRYR